MIEERILNVCIVSCMMAQKQRSEIDVIENVTEWIYLICVDYFIITTHSSETSQYE